jgi:hypothetical protein
MYIFYTVLFRHWSDVKISPVLLQPPIPALMTHKYAAFVAWQPIMRENWNSWRETCPSASLAIKCLSYGTVLFMPKDILQNKGNTADSPCTLYQPLMTHEYVAFVAWQPIMRENWNSWRETYPTASLAINWRSYGTALFMQKDILQNKDNTADSPCTLYIDMTTKAKWSSEFKW